MQRVLISLFAGAIAIATTGCPADSYGSFVVRNNLAPEEGSCTFTADENAAFFSRGVLFLDSTAPYLLAPLVQSRIVADEGKALQRTVALNGARIDLVVGPIEVISGNNVETINIDPSDAELGEGVGGVTRFTSLFSAALPPKGSVATQFDLVPLSVLAKVRARVNAPAGARVHAQVVATATLFGDIQGNEIESDPYQYPVTLCNDCVVNAPQCPLPTGTMVRTGNACNLFQDGVVDCCVEPSNGQLICPGTL